MQPRTAQQLKLDAIFDKHYNNAGDPIFRKNIYQCFCCTADVCVIPMEAGVIQTFCRDCRKPIIPIWFTWNMPVGQLSKSHEYEYLILRDEGSIERIDRGDLTGAFERINSGGNFEDGTTYDEALDIILNAKFD